jgi:hypothetical protein
VLWSKVRKSGDPDVVEVGVGAGVCMIEELKYVSRSRLNLGLSHEPLGVGRPACYSG